MQVIVKGKNLDISEETKELIDKGADGLRHFFDRIDKVEATLSSHKRGYSAEVLLSAKKMHIVSTADGKTLRDVIDAAFDKAKRSLKKQKEKLIDHRRHGPEEPLSPTATDTEQQERGTI